MRRDRLFLVGGKLHVAAVNQLAAPVSRRQIWYMVRTGLLVGCQGATVMLVLATVMHWVQCEKGASSMHSWLPCMHCAVQLCLLSVCWCNII